MPECLKASGCFTQSWFPIHGEGKPVFANKNGAMFWESGAVRVQSVREIKGATVTVTLDGACVSAKTVDIPVYESFEVLSGMPKKEGYKILITEGKRKVFEYCVEPKAEPVIPEPRKELPYFKSVKSASELYLEGLHMEQYRSPEYSAEVCYREALERDDKFVPALVALAEIYLTRTKYAEALELIDRAEKCCSEFNTRHENGRLYYLKGLILERLKSYEKAYSYYYKASWSYDHVSASMLRIGLLDLRNKDYEKAVEHFNTSLRGNVTSVLARAFLGYAYRLLGDTASAEKELDYALSQDMLNLFAHAFKAIISGSYKALSELMVSDPTQSVLDIVERLLDADLKDEAVMLIDGLSEHIDFAAMIGYARAYITGESREIIASEGIAFPSRPFEEDALNAAVEDSAQAQYLLGCMLYGKGRYEEGARHFEAVAARADDYRAYRNLAAAYYSHLGDKAKALEYMTLAAQKAPANEKQITFETAYLMAKLGKGGEDIIKLILSRNSDRDDITVELARAYNHIGDPDTALKILLDRSFVACEGGEHYIADQYMYAYYLKGAKLYEEGDYTEALKCFREAQTLPQSLGSGLWNEVKTVPYRYFEARCLAKLGKKDEAEALLREFAKYRFDYFSDMYLNTLAYYVARSYELLGQREKGEALIKKRLDAWESAKELSDMGNFGTTPFFISFIDEPSEARKGHFAYPLYLCSLFLNDSERLAKYGAMLDTDKYGIYLKDITV